MRNLRLGFTLAEVLITLAIIGIVAAMTIPSLITSYNKHVFATRLQQTYSILEQGFRTYMTEEGLDDLTDESLPWKQNSTELNKLFHKYFKITQDCKHKYKPCFKDISTYSNGVLPPFGDAYKFNECNVVVTLMNGVAICADAVSEPSEDADDGVNGGGGHAAGSVIGFEIDLNGPNKPNIGGYDTFWFAMDSNGHIYDPDYEKSGYNFNKNSLIGAMGQVKADGWKITYPIK